MIKQVLCQYCNSENVVGASNCGNCGAPLPTLGLPSSDRSAAFAAVAMPASGLMFAAALALACTFVMLLGAVEHPSKTARRIQPQAEPHVQAGSDDQSGELLADVFMVIQAGVSSVVLLGGVQMFRLQSYGLARLGGVLIMLPFVGPCCGVAAPLGIWSLIVLSRTTVREHFDRDGG